MSLDMCVGAHTGGVAIDGEITANCGRELAGLVRTLRDDGFYQRVVLQITSPGGAINAVSDFAEAQRSFGVTVVTHVPSNAGSAAAVLASLGDERLASEGATLQYHTARLPHVEGVTAFAAHSLGESLLDGDAKMVRTLADRGRAAPSPARARLGQFRPSDWQVIAHLLDDSAPPRNRRRLLTQLRAAVADAVAADRPHALRALYARLLLLDTPISASLAVELRLLDRVGEPDIGSVSQPDDGPCVTIPEWAALYRDGRVPRTALCRHTLILGETGSGKTASGVLPVVGALLAEDSPVGVSLVIDPKNEISETLTHAGSAVVHEIDLARDTLNLAEGRHSVQADLASGAVQTAANRLLRRAATLDRSSPARTLNGCPPAGRDPYWETEGARLAETVLAFTLLVCSRAGDIFGATDSRSSLLSLAGDARTALLAFAERAGVVQRSSEIDRLADEYRQQSAALRKAAEGAEHDPCDDAEGFAAAEERRQARRWRRQQAAQQAREGFLDQVAQSRLHAQSQGFRDDVAALRSDPAYANDEKALRVAVCFAAARCVDEPAPGGPNMLALALAALQTFFTDRTRHATAVAKHLRGDRRFEDGEVPDLLDAITDWWKPLAASENQFLGLIGTARTVFTPFADPVPSRVLRFGCEPGDAPATLDFRADVARRDGDGRTVYLFRAGLAREDALIARAIKACFFQSVLDCPQRTGSGGADMPLAAYVADEAHRFVTDDAAHGEQAYLDTCRSFGGCCVLATQSLSGLRRALREGDASDGGAVDLLIANTATKIVFRTTEERVLDLVERLCPSTGRVPIASVRPPATLRPGECYALLADGRFERRQLQPYVRPSAPKRAARRSRRPAPARSMR